ncbi:cell wall-binding repeat-containing protein [Clostridium sporogenes]|uniref:cell wall-binding repeat-containing protein n=1 Tax=Clostridium sporogenes TaxID=1509 RepID=UPI0013CFA771|nr:cell wall-binding repeat-containing protein [Clostridium sporogenes]MBA4506476.1 cell wall-binding repeat-containing protein [Clostridium sporogenes]MCW6106334.1 cell wall-binding repeat-containing protein [Clostridium sporogenes]MDU6334185.1 cell wall-binding repeat-containing protein [Clostridium sporogenes]NFF67627.1 cell wall-binding repeat-containing protein [Clostridium sporogenes]NFG00597.1 cell wall-binding repeat-containing protein [Clostridium sporogenes]
MLKKNKKILSVITATLVLVLGISFTNVQAASIKRMNGSNRIDTANKTAKEIFKKAPAVVLVNGNGYPDAVTAAPLAKLQGAPVLLTGNNGNLESDVLTTINDIGAKKVFIVGGTGVVSSKIESELKGKGFTVQRYAGKDRYSTNVAVGQEILKNNNGETTAFLVNGGESYADALSVTSIAAAKGYPVLFANMREVPKVVKDFIGNKKLKPLAVGGTSILPTNVVSSVNAKRITQKSKNRFETNLEVLTYFKGNGIDFSSVYVATGGQGGKIGENQFADALVAAAAASKTGAPLVLSGPAASSNDLTNAENFIETNIKDEGELYIVGGSAAVSDSIEQKLDEKVGDFRILDIF